ncbi:helix-turn-helix domain-containing protein [Thalassobacillus sp. B23F22_16]|uniref:helix-turn-helix domain-containing protein n=1 Tax=Thalassobacillus sp. B23F22_16 TaxID=3459513 RepID=UPI00373EF7A4
MKPMPDKMARLFEINRSLTQSLNLEVILPQLVQDAFRLINNADTTILYTLREDGLLHFSHGVGVDEEHMKQVKFKPGESLTGQVFLSKEGVVVQGDEFREYMETMSEENYSHFLKGVFHREIKSGIVIPLLYNEDCIGVLVVDNFDKDVQFTEEEYQLLEVVADQAAIAIMNSKLYQEVKRKNEELSYSLEIHHRFTKILLEGRGASFILETISNILQTPVEYSEDQPDAGFTFPIINANELYGYFTLQKPIESLSTIDKAALEHAATALSLEIVKRNTLFEKELHEIEEQFHDLLNGSRMKRGALRKFSLDEDSRVICMIIDSKSAPIWESHTMLQKEKLVRSLKQIVSRFCKTQVIFTKADQMVVLMAGEIKRLETLAEELRGAIQINHSIAIGIGREVSIQELSQSYREATEAAAYCKKLKGKTYVTYSELGAERLWLNTDQNLLDKFVSDKLGALFKMEKEYRETLQTFITENKSHKKTAELLHIHPNTLTYRLRKVESNLGIDLNKNEDWINMVLAFQIYYYLKC